MIMQIPRDRSCTKVDPFVNEDFSCLPGRNERKVGDVDEESPRRALFFSLLLLRDPEK